MVEWLPSLRSSLPDLAAGLTGVNAQMICRILAGYALPELCDRYPARLHIRLLPRAQGQGAGRRLVERFPSCLRSHAGRGVHLGVGTANERAIAFYEGLGVHCLEEPPWGRRYGLRLTVSDGAPQDDVPHRPSVDADASTLGAARRG